MFGLALSQWLDIVQLAALIGGGVWALFIYRTSRRGQVKVAIEYSTRLLPDFEPGKSLLLVRISLSNTSDVLWRYENAEVTVFDASKISESGAVRMVPFGQSDPFRPVYGVTSEDAAAIAAGQTFSYFEGQEISLEPGEHVQSELAFTLDNDKLGLMAVKAWFSGRQRNRSNRPYEWATFFYVDPNEVLESRENSDTTHRIGAR